jgi:hypothetical protein
MMLTIWFCRYKNWSYVDMLSESSHEMSETLALSLSSKSTVAICFQYYSVSLF